MLLSTHAEQKSKDRFQSCCATMENSDSGVGDSRGPVQSHHWRPLQSSVVISLSLKFFLSTRAGKQGWSMSSHGSRWELQSIFTAPIQHGKYSIYAILAYLLKYMNEHLPWVSLVILRKFWEGWKHRILNLVGIKVYQFHFSNPSVPYHLLYHLAWAIISHATRQPLISPTSPHFVPA